MRILFCCHVGLDRRLGMAKSYLELADAFAGIGWDARVAGPEEIAGSPRADSSPFAFPTHLRAFLQLHAAEYDVVEFDHAYLPFDRREFPDRTLMVARCLLLQHHFLKIRLPAKPSLRARVGGWLLAGRRDAGLRAFIGLADRTVSMADLTVVSNTHDAEELTAAGADPAKIAIVPLGITRRRREQFSAATATVPSRPVVAFVGTFDPRKGMCEFPRLVEETTRRLPDVGFRLLGTAGMVPDAAGVLACFPRRLRGRLDVRPTFDPDELPDLLAGCSVGVFPSHVESFGFGVLEMLAASLPVVAYAAPGPPMMLPPEFLVPRGDAAAMAGKIVALLSDPGRLGAARAWAQKRSGDFEWESIAVEMARQYRERSAGLRGSATGVGT